MLKLGGTCVMGVASECELGALLVNLNLNGRRIRCLIKRNWLWHLPWLWGRKWAGQAMGARLDLWRILRFRGIGIRRLSRSCLGRRNTFFISVCIFRIRVNIGRLICWRNLGRKSGG